MNVFVLCTGRCGSTTFARACAHADNFSAAHESRSRYLGAQRFAYPQNHIEVDNRLSWLLGRLDRHYGDQAFYVHLTRDADKVADSYVKRYGGGIMKAYRGGGIIMGLPETTEPREVALDYCDTVNDNIALFLRDKTNTMNIRLESIEADFKNFWQRIGADGDLDAAMAEFERKHNASKGEACTETLYQHYAKADQILEYGAGSSTLFAVDQGKTVVSTESNLQRMESITAQVEQAQAPGLLHDIVVDIEQAGPSGAVMNPARKKQWPEYATRCWQFCREQGIEPSVVSIDGRFRVACMVATCYFTRKPCRVFFDDYVNKPKYHAVEAFIKPVQLIDNYMAVFDVQPGMLDSRQFARYGPAFYQP